MTLWVLFFWLPILFILAIVITEAYEAGKRKADLDKDTDK